MKGEFLGKPCRYEPYFGPGMTIIVEEAMTEQLELFPDEDARSETTVEDHIHECGCGTWLCNDELCEPVVFKRYGYNDYGARECAFCEEES